MGNRIRPALGARSAKLTERVSIPVEGVFIRLLPLCFDLVVVSTCEGDLGSGEFKASTANARPVPARRALKTFKTWAPNGYCVDSVLRYF